MSKTELPNIKTLQMIENNNSPNRVASNLIEKIESVNEYNSEDEGSS